MKALRVFTIALTALALFTGLTTLGAAAAGVPNTSPTSAAYIDNQTHSIAANSSLWYRFDYAGDRSQITFTIVNGAASGLAASVFTPAQIGDWWETAPIGRGTAQVINCTSGEPDVAGGCQSDDLIWNGNFNAGGTYYVEVVNNTAGTLGFQMTIQGSGVSLAPAAPAPAAAAQPSNTGGAAAPMAQPPASTAAPSAGPSANTDPGHAMLVDNKSHTLAPNSSQWFSFNYAGDRSQILVTLPSGASSGLQFNIWTPQQASDWWDLNPIGRGTAQSINCDTGVLQENGGCQSNDLIWTGNFNANGTYYIQVINPNSNAVAAAPMVQGSGVTLGQ